MKLFKSLFSSSAVLGLLVPMNAMASEINIDEMNSYARNKSSSKKKFNSKTFSKELAKINENDERINSGINKFEAGSFSSTTTMSGSTSFVIGSIDNDEVYDSTATGSITTHYSYNIDLKTSFNGDDNLSIGLEAGSNDGTILGLDSTNYLLTTDNLYLSSIYYSFPLGSWDVAIGPKLGQDDLVSTTTSLYSDSFFFGGFYPDNTYALPGLKGSGISVARNFENGFNVGATLIGLEAGTNDGLFTKEGADLKTIMFGYDGDNYGGGIIYSKYDDIFDVGGKTGQYYLDYYGVSNLQLNTFGAGLYWIPTNKLTTNIGLNVVNADIGIDATNYTDFSLSMDYEFNEKNTFSAAWKALSFLNTNGTSDKVGDGFEFYYTHAANDSMNVKTGIYYASPSTNVGNGTTIKNGGTGDDWVLLDQVVYAFETTFKF